MATLENMNNSRWYDIVVEAGIDPIAENMLCFKIITLMEYAYKIGFKAANDNPHQPESMGR